MTCNQCHDGLGNDDDQIEDQLLFTFCDCFQVVIFIIMIFMMVVIIYDDEQSFKGFFYDNVNNSSTNDVFDELYFIVRR